MNSFIQKVKFLFFNKRSICDALNYERKIFNFFFFLVNIIHCILLVTVIAFMKSNTWIVCYFCE